MEIHRSALVPHSAEDMFDLIEGAEHYPAFIPWCAGATILAREDSIVAARITVAWQGISFEITTRNPKKRPEWLSVRMERGPFRRFDGDWHLKPLAPSACKVEFVLRCEFDSALLRAPREACWHASREDSSMHSWRARTTSIDRTQPETLRPPARCPIRVLFDDESRDCSVRGLLVTHPSGGSSIAFGN